jgi:hypothetical protein
MQGVDVGWVRIYAHTRTLSAGGLRVRLRRLAPSVRIRVRLKSPEDFLTG